MNRPYGAAYLTLSAREALKPPRIAAPSALRRRVRTAATTAARHGDAREKASELRDLLAKAKRPLVLIGLGIDPANAAADPAMGDRLESAGRGDAEGQRHRRRNRRQLCRRRQRHGGRRSDVRCAHGGRPVDRLRPRPGGDRQDLARRAADSLDPRSAERRRHRAAGTELVDHAQLLDALLGQPAAVDVAGAVPANSRRSAAKC